MKNLPYSVQVSYSYRNEEVYTFTDVRDPEEMPNTYAKRWGCPRWDLEAGIEGFIEHFGSEIGEYNIVREGSVATIYFENLPKFLQPEEEYYSFDEWFRDQGAYEELDDLHKMLEAYEYLTEGDNLAKARARVEELKAFVSEQGGQYVTGAPPIGGASIS